MPESLYNIRRDFSLKTLDESEVQSNPILQFEAWFSEALASEALEPNAMTLSTSTRDGKPTSRIVLLKQIKSEGLVFFTNYDSLKAQQLAENPHCALNFGWHELERQVRIEGVAEKISPEESDQYFDVRPAKSKLGAWASPQSQKIPNRQYLERLVADFENKFAGQEIRRPQNWGGYIIKPTFFEFWQGRASRLHDRIVYNLVDTSWTIERLAP